VETSGGGTFVSKSDLEGGLWYQAKGVGTVDVLEGPLDPMTYMMFDCALKMIAR